MKRAEAFVMTSRGHWAKAKTEFLCDCKSKGGPCLRPVKKGEAYLATTVRKFPDVAASDRRSHINLRYCFNCADQELSAGNPLLDNPAVRNALSLDRSTRQADNSNSCK